MAISKDFPISATEVVEELNSKASKSWTLLYSFTLATGVFTDYSIPAGYHELSVSIGAVNDKQLYGGFAVNIPIDIGQAQPMMIPIYDAYLGTPSPKGICYVFLDGSTRVLSLYTEKAVFNVKVRAR